MKGERGRRVSLGVELLASVISRLLDAGANEGSALGEGEAALMPLPTHPAFIFTDTHTLTAWRITHPCSTLPPKPARKGEHTLVKKGGEKE